MPEIGDILYVKTTEEPVVFHSERKLRWYEKLYLPATRAIYQVRRPIAHPSRGLRYVLHTFLAEELETASEQSARIFGIHKTRQTLASAADGPEDGPLSLKIKSSLN